MANLTLGIYETHADAETAINELFASGVNNKDISYIYTDKEGDVHDGKSGSKVGAGTVGGMTAGAVVGGIAGLVVANGILPGLGSLFVAGPLAAALGLSGVAATTVAGAATGAVAGGLIGALTQLGVNDDDAQLYETLVMKGDILVVARTESASITEVFSRTKAMEVREYYV